MLSRLPWASLGQQAWRDVGFFAGELRRRGQSVPITDLAIAVAAVRSEAALWTQDGDFRRVQLALGELRLYEPRR